MIRKVPIIKDCIISCQNLTSPIIGQNRFRRLINETSPIFWVIFLRALRVLRGKKYEVAILSLTLEGDIP